MGKRMNTSQRLIKTALVELLCIITALSTLTQISLSAPASPPPEDVLHHERGRDFLSREECDDAKDPDACREGFDEGAESYTEGK